MGLKLISTEVHARFAIDERGHECAILKYDFPSEFKDIVDCLRAFTLTKSHVLEKGKSKSRIAKAIDGLLSRRGWQEKWFDTKVSVDGKEHAMPTHSIDMFKNRVGFEVEWNNKDPFFDRDLNNFRILHQVGVLSVGVIMTRLWEMQVEFKRLGKGQSYGMNTTHFGKLLPRVDGGGAGGCPLLLIGMGMNCYDPNA